MTRLELAICEAENNGDIDIYTRDMMLDIINESADDDRERIKQLNAKYDQRLQSSVEKCSKLFRRREELFKLIDKKKTEKDRLEKERDTEVDRRNAEIYKYRKTFKSRFSNKTNKMVDDLKKYGGSVDNKIRMLDKEISALNNQAKKLEKEYWGTLDSLVVGTPIYREAEKKLDARGHLLGSFHKPIKESVLEDIYEAELNGEITPEERQSLIDYMNI